MVNSAIHPGSVVRKIDSACYPPDSEFFQLLQKGMKSSETKNIDIAREIKEL